jgi:hypothetical protein
MYRLHPLYGALVPRIAGVLKEMGHSVDVTVFSMGTDVHAGDVKPAEGSIVIADHTVGRHCSEYESLDRAVAAGSSFPTAGLSIYVPSMYLSEHKWMLEIGKAMHTYGKRFTELTRGLAVEGCDVYIVRDCLTEHTPFLEAYGQFRCKDVTHPFRSEDPESVLLRHTINTTLKRQGCSPMIAYERESGPELFLERWLKEAGVSPEKIHTELGSDVVTKRPSDKPYLFCDHHWYHHLSEEDRKIVDSDYRVIRISSGFMAEDLASCGVLPESVGGELDIEAVVRHILHL